MRRVVRASAALALPGIALSLQGNRLDAGSVMIPKGKTSGEDAFIEEAALRVWAVFDGVGGWSDVGVDPALFSRNLALQTCAACRRIDAGRSVGLSAPELRRALVDGLSRVSDPGSSTACLVSIAPTGELTCANVGDSGVRVFRPQTNDRVGVACRSNEMTHYFNCPHQLSAKGRGGDRAESSDLYSFVVRPGDTVVLATDGCFDNLWEADLCQVVQEHRSSPAAATAAAIAERARVASLRTTGDSPFASSGRKHGYVFRGGKPDDITVICIRVLAHPEASDDATAEANGEKARSKL